MFPVFHEWNANGANIDKKTFENKFLWYNYEHMYTTRVLEKLSLYIFKIMKVYNLKA